MNILVLTMTKSVLDDAITSLFLERIQGAVGNQAAVVTMGVFCSNSEKKYFVYPFYLNHQYNQTI